MSQLLGPRGKATVILFSAHFDSELPKLKELKKILSIPDGRFYKSNGHHAREIYLLQELLGTVHKIRATGKKLYDFRSSDFFVTVAEVDSNLFMKMKYDAEVVDGFNLTTQGLEELKKILGNFTEINSMRSQVSRMPETLISQQKSAIENGFIDTTVLNPDIEGLKKMLADYGDKQQVQVYESVEQWYETYRWKVTSPTRPKANSDDSEINESFDEDESEKAEAT